MHRHSRVHGKLPLLSQCFHASHQCDLRNQGSQNVTALRWLLTCSKRSVLLEYRLLFRLSQVTFRLTAEKNPPLLFQMQDCWKEITATVWPILLPPWVCQSNRQPFFGTSFCKASQDRENQRLDGSSWKSMTLFSRQPYLKMTLFCRQEVQSQQIRT